LPRGKQGNANEKWRIIDRQSDVVAYEHSFLRGQRIMMIYPFNTTHILMIILMPVLIFTVINIALSKREEKTMATVLLLISAFNAGLYIVYKFAQVADPNFHFDLLTNLPLHFCNINLILIPLAIYTKNKTLMAYQVYFGTPLAGLALITVYPAFIGTSIFGFTTFVYFFYHSMLFAIPLILIKLRLFTPSFKNILQPTLMLVALTFFMHMFNVVLRATGLAYGANYFFTFGLEGDFFTELLWGIIPFNFFFLLPSLLLFAPYVLIITLPFHLSAKARQ